MDLHDLNGYSTQLKGVEYYYNGPFKIWLLEMGEIRVETW